MWRDVHTRGRCAQEHERGRGSAGAAEVVVFQVFMGRCVVGALSNCRAALWLLQAAAAGRLAF